MVASGAVGWSAPRPLVRAEEPAPPACGRGPLTISATPAGVGPVAPHTTGVFEVLVTNGDQAGCGPRSLLFDLPVRPDGMALFPAPPHLRVAPGQIARFILSVTGTSEAPAGGHTVPFRVRDSSTSMLAEGQVEYVLRPESGCFVRPDRELFINDLSVVEDPVRTTFAGAEDDPRRGAWTFGRLMESIAPSAEDAPAFVEQLFRTWMTDQTVNGFTIPARKQVDAMVLRDWPRRVDGALDLTRSPMRLLAIANRMDLRAGKRAGAGQGRFVFGLLDRVGFPVPFTIILEYRLPARSRRDVRAWAQAWHALGALPHPGESYNATLQAITDRFTGRGADPHAVNGSALVSLRTNDAALTFPWELRSFRLARENGLALPASAELTPDLAFAGTALLADFINEHEEAILAGDHTVPRLYRGLPFRAAASLNTTGLWTAPGIANPRARREFALQTCSGCHGPIETRTGFTHVSIRWAGTRAALSGLLTGVAVADPFTGELRTFNELHRRKMDLQAMVCGGDEDGDGDGRYPAVGRARNLSHPDEEDPADRQANRHPSARP